jgi:hypothetical protein
VINVLYSDSQAKIFERIKGISVPLSSCFNVFNGVKPFEVGKGKPPQTKTIATEKPYVFDGTRPNDEWSPLLRGSLINRYVLLWDKNYWIKYGPWLAAQRDPEIFEAPEKIMIRQTDDSLKATLITSGFIARNNLHIIVPKSEDISLKFILGVINSKLLDFLYSFINPEKGEALAEVKKQHVEILPVIKAPIESQKPIVNLVDQMLATKKQLAATQRDSEREQFQRKCDYLDGEIDRLVYELYGLTAEEIKIVEGS